MSLGRARLLAAALLVSASGCGGCGASQGPKGGPNCAPSLSLYSGDYREPDVAATPDIHIDGQSPGAHLQVNFPAASNAGLERLTYWLTGTEDAELAIEVGLGPDSGFPNAVTVYTSLLVDGAPAPLMVEGQPAPPALKADLTTGAVQIFHATLAHDAIADGAHSATLLSWQSEGKSWGAWSFTILKNGYAFPAATPEGTPAPKPSTVGVFDRATGRILYGQYQPGSDGTVHATANLEPVLQGCPALDYDLALVTVLDDRPIQVGGAFAHFTRAKLGAGQALAVDLSGLPVSDGVRHYLSFWMLTGTSQYAEAPLGAQSPWHAPAERLAIAIWGP